MALSFKHTFASAKADGVDTSLIQPSHWNAEHTVTLTGPALVGRSTAGSGAAGEITIGTGLSLSGGVLSVSGSLSGSTLTGATLSGATMTGVTTFPATSSVSGTGIATFAGFTTTGATSTGTLTASGAATLASGTFSGTLGVTGLTTLGAVSIGGAVSGAAVATTANFWANTSNKILTTDQVWAAAAPVAIAFTTTITPDFSTGINFSVTATNNFTLANPTNVKVGQSGYIAITQDGTGSRVMTLGSNWKFPTGESKVLSTAAGAVDVLYYTVHASNYFLCSLAKAYA